MKPVFTTATALLALIATSSVVAAQQDGKQQAPAAQQQAPAAQQEGKQGGAPEKSQPSRTQAQEKAPAAKEKRAEPSNQPASKEKQAQPKDTPAKEKQAQPKDTPATKDKQAQPKDTPAKDKQASDKDSPATSKDKQAQPKDTSTTKDKQAQPKDTPAAKDKQAATKDQAGRTQVTEEKRTRIRQSINVTNVERVTNVNFSISIGSRVPDRVRFYPVPVTIIEFAPEYRDHEYFVVEDRICIVEPRTRAIVLVIDGDGRRSSGQQIAVLELSSEQRQFILANVDRDRHRADVRVRLALGADVPQQVELYTFPDVVISRVPSLGDYRFIVVENEVIVVDPRDRGVALVVSQ